MRNWKQDELKDDCKITKKDDIHNVSRRKNSTNFEETQPITTFRNDSQLANIAHRKNL